MNAALLLCGVCLTISGCSWPDWATVNSDPFSGLTSEDKISAPPAPQNSPLSLKSDYDPLVNAQPLELQPGGPLGSLGLNLDLYLDPGIEDKDTRIDRLERAVSAIHRDLKSVAPQLQAMGAPNVIAAPLSLERAASMPIASITSATAPSNSAPMINAPAPANTAPTSLFTPPPQAAITTQTIVTRQALQGLAPMPGGRIIAPPSNATYGYTSKNSVPITVPAANIPPPAPPPIGVQAAVDKGPRDVQNGGSAIVSGIRFGQHPDKVRIVFDVTKKTSYSVDLDNSENILVVEMPNAKWKTPTTSENFGALPIVKSYKVESFNGSAGNIFILQLKKDTVIKMQGKFPALSGNGERIVIDLQK